jgi:hypothetical protein
MTRLAVLALLAAIAPIACTAEPARESAPTSSPEVATTPTATAQPPLDQLYRLHPYVRPEAGVPSPPVMRVPPSTVAAAEIEGPLYLGEHAYTGAPPPSFDGVPGTAEARCVEVNPNSPTRSRDWLIDTSARRGPDPTLVLLPANPSAVYRSGLWINFLLRAVRLDGPQWTYVHEIRSGASSLEGDRIGYEPRFRPPEAGRWLVVVTAGPQWGCFIFDVPTRADASTLGKSTAEIEVLGAAYHSAPAPANPLEGFTRRYSSGTLADAGLSEGTPERRCIRGASGAPRSGEFIMSPYSWGVGWAPDLLGSKIGFTPLHQPEDRKRLDYPLRIEATLLDDIRHTYAYEERGNAYGLDNNDRPTGAFFVTSFVFPRAGRWAAVTTAGPDWGCFLLDVG